jgi:hypothetical protein
MSLIYEWIDENQYLNQYIPYNTTNGKVNVYLYDNNKNDYVYKFCYYIPIETVPNNAVAKSVNNSLEYIKETNNITTETNQLQYVEQNNLYTLTLPGGSQIILDQSQTISYLYNLAIQAFQKISLLEKSLVEETNKNLLLTQEIENQKVFASQLYESNKTLSNEYYKVQQTQLIKAEQNILNKRIDTFNKRNNKNKESVQNVEPKTKVEVKDVEVQVKDVETEVKNVQTEIKNVETEIKNDDIKVKDVETKVKKEISWLEMNESEEEDNKIKKSYAEITQNNVTLKRISDEKLNKTSSKSRRSRRSKENVSSRTNTRESSSKVVILDDEGGKWERVGGVGGVKRR